MRRQHRDCSTFPPFPCCCQPDGLVPCCRVAAPLNTASPARQHLQVPWEAAALSAAQHSAGEQQKQQHPQDAADETAIAPFATSSSPVPDSPNSSRGVGHVDQAGGRPTEPQQTSAVELLASSKQQLGTPRDSHPLLRQQPCKVGKGMTALCCGDRCCECSCCSSGHEY